MKKLLVLASLAVCGSAMAQFVTDGIMNESGYGLPLAIQISETGFGNSNLGSPIWANGSELDQLFVGADSSNLHIGLAGNLETAFNKFVIFFDAKSGGQNALTLPQPDIDYGYLNNMAADPNGLVFDAGFNPDYAINVTNGDTGGGVYGLFANWFNIGVAGGYPAGGAYLGSHGDVPGPLSGGDDNYGISAHIDNSNIGGVGDGGGNAWQAGGIGSGAGVLTGAEVSIPLSLLDGACDLKMMAVLTGGGGEYWSNQILPSLDGSYGNLSFIFGNAPLINLSGLTGPARFITIRPSVSGTITLNDLDTVSAQTGWVKWFDGNNNLVAEGEFTLNADGTYKACGPIQGGNYQMCVKVSTFLSSMAAVNTTGGAITGVAFSLINGDVDGDDEVGPGDFAILSGAFGNSLGDSGYVAGADLDKNEEVGPSDFSILSSNFGESGDCP